MTKVGLLMLLAIGEEIEPVSNDLAHLDPLTPSIEHLWLQVIVRAVAVLPTGDGSCQQL